MNQYGRQAQEFWRTHRPENYAEMTDPTEFFSTLGQQIADEIATLSAEMASTEPAADNYLDRVGQLNRIQQQAREQVLHEMVFADSEASPQT